MGTGCAGPVAARLALLRAQRQLYTDADVHIHLRNFNVINEARCSLASHTLYHPLIVVLILCTGGSRVFARNFKLRGVCDGSLVDRPLRRQVLRRSRVAACRRAHLLRCAASALSPFACVDPRCVCTLAGLRINLYLKTAGQCTCYHLFQMKLPIKAAMPNVVLVEPYY